ncbi:MAG: hypothetical protein H7288_13390 [Kineosporiaceae bacterium]|nr:hypothetical protein [Aeromicrobium sp.]
MNEILRYSAIYNADGGIVGEVRYVIGHLLGITECALCDITHSPVRRKPEWDRMLARLGAPMTVLHRNEVDPSLLASIGTTQLPAVFAHHPDGTVTVALSAQELTAMGGSVSAFEAALTGRSP